MNSCDSLGLLHPFRDDLGGAACRRYKWVRPLRETVKQPVSMVRNAIHQVMNLTATTAKIEQWIANGFSLISTLSEFNAEIGKFRYIEKAVAEKYDRINKILDEMTQIMKQKNWYLNREHKQQLAVLCQRLPPEFQGVLQASAEGRRCADNAQILAEERAGEWGVSDYISDRWKIFQSRR